MSINLPVQYVKNASTASVTTLSATLAATGAGNLLVAVVAVGSTASNGTCTTPAGWTLAVGPVSTNSGTVADVNLYIFFKIDTAGGTTSVTFTDNVASGITIEVYEFSSTSGWPANPFDVGAFSANQASTATPVSGTTAATAQASEVWIAAFSTHISQTETWSGPTNSFTLETAAAATSGFFNPQTATSYRIASATGAASSGVTVNHASVFAGAIATFKDTVGGTPQAIAGTGAAAAAGTVSLTVTKPIAGSTSAASTSLVSLTVTKKLAGVFAAGSTDAAVLTVSKLLAVHGVASAAGSVQLIGPVSLTGSAAAVASAQATLAVTKHLAGTVSAQASASVTITRTAGLAGIVQAQASASASLSVTKPLAGTASASSNATVILSVVDAHYRVPTATILLAAFVSALLQEPSTTPTASIELLPSPEGAAQ